MYKTLFPGQDYNDARIVDFQHVDHYVSNTISILEQPRMPWQDVRASLIFPEGHLLIPRVDPYDVNGSGCLGY